MQILIRLIILFHLLIKKIEHVPDKDSLARLLIKLLMLLIIIIKL